MCQKAATPLRSFPVEGVLLRLAGHCDRDNDIGGALERFVLADADEGRRDEELIVLLHERNLRVQTSNGPPGSAIARHNTIQSFPG